MPGLVPASTFYSSKRKKDVDGRDKPGHDETILATLHRNKRAIRYPV